MAVDAATVTTVEKRTCANCEHEWPLDMFNRYPKGYARLCRGCERSHREALKNGAKIAPPRDAFTGARLGAVAASPASPASSQLAQPTTPPSASPSGQPLSERYGLLIALLKRLPSDGRWTEARSRRWIDAFLCLLEEVVETTPTTQPDSAKPE